MPPERESTNLEEMALLELGLVDIQVIAEYNNFINTQPVETPLPLVSDPFWSEFNEWRNSNEDAYNEWLNNLPASDTADANNAQDATDQQQQNNNEQSSDSTGESSSYETTVTLTGTGSSTSVKTTTSSSSNNSFFTAPSYSSDDTFLTCPELQTPPDSLAVFCDEFSVSQNHRSMFLPGVRIWPTAKSVPRKPKTRSTPTLDCYLANLKKAGIIEPSKRGLFVASLFIIPKQDGKARLKVDYSNITPILRPPKFYLPSIYQLLHKKLFPFSNPFYIKIDLKNAFYNIAIQEKSRYITIFWYAGKYYRFKYLPFGLSIAPFFCEILTNYITKYFSDRKVFSWVHLDDLIAVSDDKNLLKEILNEVLMKLQRSNILINKKKSSLTPKNSIEFLGANWAKEGITRVSKVDYQIIEIINFISRRKRSYSLKKGQQIAGYLN